MATSINYSKMDLKQTTAQISYKKKHTDEIFISVKFGPAHFKTIPEYL